MREACELPNLIWIVRGLLLHHEIIVTGPLAAGLRDGHCVHACFDALEQLDERAKAYIRDFGLRANFRAALHCGPVAIGELGTIKMEIAFLGDTMNTSALPCFEHVLD